MERIRIGNDIQVKFTVYRNGEAESFIDATGIQVIVRNEAYNEIIPNTYSISQNIVTINLDAINLTKCGKHRVILSYHKGRDFAIDSMAFELVEFSAGENGTVSIDGIISISKDGKSAYEVWRAYPGNEEKTEEDYFEWLQKPSIDASIVAMSAAGFANEKANLANEKSILANNAANNADEKATLANTATTNANTARNAAIIATDLANTATDNANAATTAANSAAASAGTTTSMYNVTVSIPLSPGVYYTKATARAAVPVASRKIGLVNTYALSASTWYTEKYIGANVSGWTTESNWEQVPDAARVAAIETDFNQLSGEVNSYRNAVVVFSINENNELIVSMPDTLTDVYTIDSNGNLILTY